MEKAEVIPAIKTCYGLDAESWGLESFFSSSTRADNLKIAGLAALKIKSTGSRHAIISRNLYAAYWLGVVRRLPIIFETHQLEFGLRQGLQRAVMTCPWITTVLISRRLEECLSEHHGGRPAKSIVLHDAAPDGIIPLPYQGRRHHLNLLVPSVPDKRWDAVCGYFGHLYPGRGLEIIQAMASMRPRTLFLIYGGNEADIVRYRTEISMSNLWFMGHVPYPTAKELMLCMDFLLMPYQNSVSIGVGNHDTAKWMSPMKMFEYLATGVPVISSDLPVLREVLVDQQNAILVKPDDPERWVEALDNLIKAPEMAEAIGERAHSDYKSKYTWKMRGISLLDAAGAI